MSNASGPTIPAASTGTSQAVASIEQSFARRYWVLGVVALVALLTSFLLDVALELVREHTPRGDFWWRVFGFFVRMLAQLSVEVGFAFLIALILGIVIERAARIAQQGSIDRAISAIAQDVLRETYAVTTPRQIVSLAISSVFEVPIIRREHKMVLTIKPIDEIVDGETIRQKLLVVESDALLENTSGRAVTHEIRLQLPTRLEEPLRDMAKLTGGLIGTRYLDEAYIKEGDEGALDTVYERKYLWKCELRAGESVRVIFNYQVVKDDSDNEVWTSLLPSFGPEVVVDMQCPDLEWGLDGLFSGAFRELDGKTGARRAGRSRFIAPAPLLPYQGLVVWWRPARTAPPAPPAPPVVTTQASPKAPNSPVGET